MKVLALILAALMMPRSALSAPEATSIRTQVGYIPIGSKIELRLMGNEKRRGTMGKVSESGFGLIDSRTGENQVSFTEVISVRRLKPQTGRNVMIGITVGVAIVMVLAIAFRGKVVGFGFSDKF